jgi:hypothetical protein
MHSSSSSANGTPVVFISPGDDRLDSFGSRVVVQDRSDGHHGTVGDGCRWPQWHCRLLLPIQKSTLVVRTDGHTDSVG